MVNPVLQRFLAAARDNRCTVHGPLAPPAAGTTIASVASERADGGEVAVGDDPLLDELAIPDLLSARGATMLRPTDPTWSTRIARATVGLTSARLGVADTGSLLLGSSAGSPRATGLLPPAHVCILRTGAIVAEVADALEILARDPLPSAVTWIGGPSRTGDIEFRITFSVHGPKTVDVVLIDG